MGGDQPITTSFKPEQLQTLEYVSGADPVTKTMDFAVLPCPPSDVAQAYDPGTPYYPVLLLPWELTFFFVSQNGQIDGIDCQVAAVRDPPVYARRVGQISGPNDGGDTIARRGD